MTKRHLKIVKLMKIFKLLKNFKFKIKKTYVFLADIGDIGKLLFSNEFYCRERQ